MTAPVIVIYYFLINNSEQSYLIYVSLKFRYLKIRNFLTYFEHLFGDFKALPLPGGLVVRMQHPHCPGLGSCSQGTLVLGQPV